MGVIGLAEMLEGVSGSGLNLVPGPVSSEGSGAMRGLLMYSSAYTLN